VFELPGNSTTRRMTLRFSGIAMETVEVSVLTRSLNRGEVIKTSDLVTERRQKSETTIDALSIDTAVGLAAKRPLRVGSMLRQDDATKPDAVQRNETVTIVYEAPGFMLTVRGKALESGSLGDTVNVLNTQSNRNVQATIVGPGRVNVAAMPRPAMTVSVPDSTNASPPSVQ
jgi:flagella basal body P-ring formation protein FlgA